MKTLEYSNMMDECETKRRIHERGYAFVQVQLADGSWSTITVIDGYRNAQNYANTMQANLTRRNHRVYHFRVI